MNETSTYKKFKSIKQDNFPEWLIIHHTGGENGVDTSNQTAKIVEDYHLSLGWEGIGYHFFIPKDGSLWYGRPETYHGAHTKEQGMNSKSIGICLAGNFDVTLPTKAQIDTLKALIKLKMGQYNIPETKVVPHRHFATYKSCFGSKLGDGWLKEIMIPITTGDPNKDKIRQVIGILESLL
jgi:N-acetylmuramoyl-L-alanine amidase